MSERKSGVVKFFNTEKGFGFVKVDDGSKDVFLHVSQLDGQDVDEGDKLSFDVQEGDRGLRAVAVQKIEA